MPEQLRVGRLTFQAEFIEGHVYLATCQCGVPVLVSKDEWGTGSVLGCLECELRRDPKLREWRPTLAA